MTKTPNAASGPGVRVPSLRRCAALSLAGLSAVLCGVLGVAAPASAASSQVVTNPKHPQALAHCVLDCQGAATLIPVPNGTAVRVLCWYQGARAWRNYWSQKWFLVSIAGQPGQSKWEIHSSYVRNPTTAPRCG